MPLGILGKKIGMGQLFDESGAVVPVTLIQAGPCPVLQKRTPSLDGYEAIQLGFDEQRESLVDKPMAGHFKKAGAKACRFIREFRGGETQSFEVGQTIDVGIFKAGEKVDVLGVSKGRGFQGPRKRHGSKPGPASHGSMYHNRPGSNGGSSFPARTFPGKPLAGRMGGERVTAKNLVVVKTDPSKNLIFVRGSVPGCNSGYVMIRKHVATKAK